MLNISKMLRWYLRWVRRCARISNQTQISLLVFLVDSTIRVIVYPVAPVASTVDVITIALFATVILRFVLFMFLFFKKLACHLSRNKWFRDARTSLLLVCPFHFDMTPLRFCSGWFGGNLIVPNFLHVWGIRTASLKLMSAISRVSEFRHPVC